jgi:hypothetical protein
MLGDAGKGVPSDRGSLVHYHLQRAVQALSGLARVAGIFIEKQRLEPGGIPGIFGCVRPRDSLAALEIMRVQPTISSQLIDNLNANIHLRRPWCCAATKSQSPLEYGPSSRAQYFKKKMTRSLREIL